MDKRQLKEALLQSALRMIPLIPANEVKTVINAIRKTETEFDKDVEDALESIKKSSELVQSLGNKLKERSELLERLKQEYSRLSELTSITKEQTAALAEALRETIGSACRKERIISLAINLFAGLIVFILGVIFGPFLTRLIGWLF